MSVLLLLSFVSKVKLEVDGLFLSLFSIISISELDEESEERQQTSLSTFL